MFHSLPSTLLNTQTITTNSECIIFRPEDLDVKVEGNSIVITAKQELPEAGGVRTRVFEQKVNLISPPSSSPLSLSSSPSRPE